MSDADNAIVRFILTSHNQPTAVTNHPMLAVMIEFAQRNPGLAGKIDQRSRKCAE
jgi:hypothetical protein